MKKAHLLLVLFLSLIFSTVEAASFPAAPAGPWADSSLSSSFLRQSPRSLEEATGQKLRWYEKLSLKIIQRKLQKRAQDEGQPLSQSTKVLSVVSLVAGALTVAMLFAGVGVGFLIFVLTGLITGIIALAGNRNRGNKHRTMAILGIVLSGVMILLVLAALIAWAAAWN
jgi:hypothetical protein